MRLLPGIPMTAAGTSCYRCSHDGRPDPVLDTEIIVEMEGDLIFCQSCVTEMGRMIGLASADQLERVEAKAEASEARAVAAERALAEYRQNVKAAVGG